MTYLAYIPVIAAIALVGLSLVALIKKAFLFWPPPAKASWQNQTFMTLFRIMVYGSITTSIWHVWRFGMDVSLARVWTAAFLIAIGFAGAFWATFGLGWKNAFGAKEGLRIEGAFSFSRNPIYVATWFGLAGWALLIPQTVIQVTLLCWAVMYLVAIFLEERWLRCQYGLTFESYCVKVRRFF